LFSFVWWLAGLVLVLSCSRHGFLYIRGWMQMVIAPNDLFSWNNRYNKYNGTKDIYTFFLRLCTSTYSVHARVLKPWRGSLLWLSATFSSCHVFPPSLFGLNWRSLSPLGGPGPSTSKMAPLFTGSAHTPSPGFSTCPIRELEANSFEMSPHYERILKEVTCRLHRMIPNNRSGDGLRVWPVLETCK
jgi:hypothetical protein